ncbi:MAG: cytochrome c biogenesis protein CcsA, partial [Candidatus Bathyarchaeota archaeon]
MEIAEILLIGAAVLVFGDLVQLVNSKNGGAKGMGIPMAPFACLLIIGSYLTLAQAFITNNFRYEEVYAYSSSGLPVMGRLYASWASSASSWLFLTFLLALGYLMIRFAMRERELRLKAFEVLDILFLFFIVVVLLQSPFRLLPEAQMDGRGLNPLLKTPWMLIHPPVVFIGYTLTFFSFAFTFDSFGSERQSASVLVRVFAQLSWLFLTLGIALGGLWAYEVLGWGGYWAWDPVETASLIPWISLTALFHLSPAISGRETSSRDLMVMVTSSLIVLATAITRGGLAVSVHAFGSSPIGLVLLLLMGVMIAYFLYGQRRSGAHLFDFNIETNSVYTGALSLSFL